MGLNKITEKTVVSSVDDSTYVVVTQEDNEKSRVKRLPVSILPKHFGVDKLKKLTDLIPLGNGDSYNIDFKKIIGASLMDAAGTYVAVDGEYAYCAYYTGLSAYVGETLYVSGACSQTYPLYVFKDVDGIVIDMGWVAGTEELTVVEDYAVTVPEDAATIYINQLTGYDLTPCVIGYFPKMEVGEENLAETVVKKINNAAVKTEVHSAFSNALKGTASGAIVALDGVSPVEHEVECVVRSKNLLKYPYYQTTKTQNGITFTDNGDGSITINGTATANTTFILGGSTVAKSPRKLPKGVWVTANSNSPNVQLAIQAIKDDGSLNGVAYMYNGSKKFFTDYENYYVYLYVSEGKEVNSETVYPQLEEGTESTDWVPYVAPESVTLSEYGKNFAKYSEKTVMGTTAWKNGNFTITLQPGKYVYSCNFAQTGLTEWTVDDVAYKVYTSITIKPKGSTVNIAYVKSENTKGSLNCAFEVSAFGEYLISFYSNYSSNVLPESGVCEFTNIQLEVDKGTGLPTEFEEPVVTAYVPNADGTVEDMTSLAPNMTLMTDTENTYAYVTYNRDINKAFEEMYNAIISLGGNV